MKKQEKIEILIAKSLIKGNLLDEECEILCKITISELISKYGLRLEEAKFVHKWCNSCINKNFYELVDKDIDVKNLNEGIYEWWESIDFDDKLFKIDNVCTNFLHDVSKINKEFKKYNKSKTTFIRKNTVEIAKQNLSQYDKKVLNTENKENIFKYLKEQRVDKIQKVLETLFEFSKRQYLRSSSKQGFFGKMFRKSRADRSKNIRSINSGFIIDKSEFLTESRQDIIKNFLKSIRNNRTIKTRYPSYNDSRIDSIFQNRLNHYNKELIDIRECLEDIQNKRYSVVDIESLYIVFLINDSILSRKFPQYTSDPNFNKNLYEFLERVFKTKIVTKTDYTSTNLRRDHRPTYTDYAFFNVLNTFMTSNLEIINLLTNKSSSKKLVNDIENSIKSIMGDINSSNNSNNKKSFSSNDFYYLLCLSIKENFWPEFNEFKKQFEDYYNK